MLIYDDEQKFVRSFFLQGKGINCLWVSSFYSFMSKPKGCFASKCLYFPLRSFNAYFSEKSLRLTTSGYFLATKIVVLLATFEQLLTTFGLLKFQTFLNFLVETTFFQHFFSVNFFCQNFIDV